MNLHERNISILEHIVSYCDQIEETIQRFGDNQEIFLSDKVYRNAAALCILQIGELVSNLTDDFKEQHKGIPWKQIKNMRNIIAHRYGTFDAEMTWNTMKTDVPDLKQYCMQILQENEDMDNDSCKSNNIV